MRHCVSIVLILVGLFLSVQKAHAEITWAMVAAKKQEALSAAADKATAKANAVAERAFAVTAQSSFDLKSQSHLTECESDATNGDDEAATEELGVGDNHCAVGAQLHTLAVNEYEDGIDAEHGTGAFAPTPDVDQAYYNYQWAVNAWEASKDRYVDAACCFVLANGYWGDAIDLIEDAVLAEDCLICNGDVCGDGGGEGEPE